jgi:glycine dehydrogenase
VWVRQAGAIGTVDPGTNVAGFERRSPFLTHPIFNTIHSETEMMRYCKYLEVGFARTGHRTALLPLQLCHSFTVLQL